jgi:hypothetical protein
MSEGSDLMLEHGYGKSNAISSVKLDCLFHLLMSFIELRYPYDAVCLKSCKVGSTQKLYRPNIFNINGISRLIDRSDFGNFKFRRYDTSENRAFRDMSNGKKV